MEDRKENDSGWMDEKHLRVLEMIVEKQEKTIRVSWIVAVAECVLLTILLILAAFLVPRILRTVNNVDETLKEADVLIAQSEQSLEEVMILVEDTDKLVKTNDQAISDAIDNFNNVDFDSLNASIASLSEILKPLADLLGVFN